MSFMAVRVFNILHTQLTESDIFYLGGLRPCIPRRPRHLRKGASQRPLRTHQLFNCQLPHRCPLPMYVSAHDSPYNLPHPLSSTMRLHPPKQLPIPTTPHSLPHSPRLTPLFSSLSSFLRHLLRHRLLALRLPSHGPRLPHLDPLPLPRPPRRRIPRRPPRLPLPQLRPRPRAHRLRQRPLDVRRRLPRPARPPQRVLQIRLQLHRLPGICLQGDDGQ